MMNWFVHIFNLTALNTVLHTAWVRCSGIEYRCGSVVCIDVVDEMPVTKFVGRKEADRVGL